MICHDLKQKVQALLDDTLPEHERILFEEHLQGCSVCRLEIKHAQGGETVRSRWLKAAAAANAVIIAAALFYFLYGAKFKEAWEKNPDTDSLLQLQVHADQSVEKEPKPKRIIHLKPLHWDIYFPSLFNRDTAHRKVLLLNHQAVYEDPEFLILTLDRTGLQPLLKALKDSGGFFQGGGDLLTAQIPEFDRDFRVSIHLHAPQSRVSRPLSHHWHLSFQLPNRFIAKDAIREAGARFLFEEPEIWVVEIAAAKLPQLQEALRGIHGLEIYSGEVIPSAESYRNVPAKISLYITQG